MPATELDVWIRARELLARGWTQGVYARDDLGHSVNPRRGDARCFCTSGAAIRVREQLGFGGPVRLTVPGQYPSVIEWNDDPNRTQAEVLAAVDARIAELRSNQETTRS